VLLSGGLDSTTVLAYAIAQGFTPVALSFSYGQRHEVELEAAKRVVARYGVQRHEVVTIDLRAFGGSSLTSALEVPHRSDGVVPTNEIPSTYVPARNTIFLSFALALAEVCGAQDIFIGVNALDYSGYPDCRPAFLEAFERLANLATKEGVEGRLRTTIHAPLLMRSKAEIIELGRSLGVDYGLTHSCYDPEADGRPCGTCDSCLLRARGFAEVGVPDPAVSERP
jgi:7-cyano-7-deazaguanine synthase